MWILIGTAAYFFLFIANPFLLWRSFAVVLRAVITEPQVKMTARFRMLWHLLKELAAAPLNTVFWYLDGLIFPKYRSYHPLEPIFIMSQPRSGTTFLLRTLAADNASFFSLKHIEWRLPFICLWKGLDLLKLRKWAENINYWPDTELGRLASKIHAHRLGSTEEHGIFFEERMYHHYFTFRRFPFAAVLDRVGKFETLTEGEKRKLLRTFSAVVAKAAVFRGTGRIWLTKENESVQSYRLLRKAFPDARFLVILREPEAFVSSYVTMSKTCTIAKHGVDPTIIADWHNINMSFRKMECEQMVEFCRELEDEDKIVYVTFDEFTRNIESTVRYIYARFGLTMQPAYEQYLSNLQAEQNQRDAGYKNAPQDVHGFESFTFFVREKAGQQLTSNSEKKEAIS